MFRIVAALILALTLSTVRVYAADESASPATTPVDFASAIKSSNTMSRPAALPALYVSYAALQVFDVYSTRQALAQGAREANPLMAPVVRNQSALWAVKTSAAVGTILAAEHLWKKKNNKKGAIAVLVASNAVAAVVAARNASVLRSQR
jgi:O-antigen/teichoic acid export membrane protein